MNQTVESFVAVVYSLSHVCFFVTSRTVARQAPLSMGFPRQECWSRLPFPSSGDLPDPGIKSTSLASPVLTGGFSPQLPHHGSCRRVQECISLPEGIFLVNRREGL